MVLVDVYHLLNRMEDKTMDKKKYELRKELPLIMAGNKFYRIKSLRI